MTMVFDPVNELLRLQGELDTLLRSPSSAFSGGLTAAGAYPHLNLFRDEQGLVVRTELPGVRSEDVTVTVDQGRLTIAGERKPDQDERGGYHRRERSWGRFTRTVQLPDHLDVEKANAEFRNGVMTVRIPLLAEAKPRQITVNAA